jgi:putative ABC transport system permease protein
MDNFGYYVELAYRAILRNRVLSALMILALSVGIAACMTTMTVFHILSGDPLPGRSGNIFYPQLDGDPQHVDSNAPWDLLDYRTANDLAAATPPSRHALIASTAASIARTSEVLQPVAGHLLATNRGFFEMFAVPFRYGRPWLQDDEERHARIVVISEELNQQLFGGRDSTEQVIRIQGIDYRISGVLAAWRPKPLFYEVAGGALMRDSASTFFGKVEDAIVPFTTAVEVHRKLFNPWYCWRNQEANDDITGSNSCLWVQLWVWLDSPDTVNKFSRYMGNYAAQQRALGRFEVTPSTKLSSLTEWLSYNGVVPDSVRLQVGMAFCFLIVCLCNAIGLLFAKFAEREREFGLRRALGAPKRAVFLQCLVEALIISLLGGTGGLLLSLLGLGVIRLQPFSYADLARLDVPMFVSLLVLSTACGLLIALIPAIRAAFVSPASQVGGH